MAIISVRTDDNTKQEAEKLTKSIGISLSSAINVFLKRFVEEKGFPFDLTPPAYRSSAEVTADCNENDEVTSAPDVAEVTKDTPELLSEV